MVKEKWICDKCNRVISTVEKGRLKWTKNMNDDTISNFKIVHHPACEQPEPKIQSSQLATPGGLLKEFLGKDGLIHLLELLPQTNKEDQAQLLEVIQRLHIPGYENARLSFDQAYANQEIVPPINDIYYPTTEKIKEINKKYGNKLKE